MSPDLLRRYPVGVRVARLRQHIWYDDGSGLTNTESNPNAAVYRDSRGQSLFPLVMYRSEVATPARPAVSGDLIQVTPLISQIAVSGGGDQLYLRDTQPVIKNARYRYLLVRFTPNGEVAQIIPTNEVTIAAP
jgi:hypothetical protein